jgi:hypothetical protein
MSGKSQIIHLSLFYLKDVYEVIKDGASYVSLAKTEVFKSIDKVKYSWRYLITWFRLMECFLKGNQEIKW